MERTWKRAGIRAAVATASGFFALEIALQIGSLATAALSTAESVAGTDIVCIGDSFTAGIGATAPDKSYPSGLERLLRQRAPGIRVANMGLPGQDSAYMLDRAFGNITEKTKIVVALMAFNDTWARPARVDGYTATDVRRSAWTLRWRTGRLIALATRFDANSWFDDSVGERPTSEQEWKDPSAGFAMLDDIGITSLTAPTPIMAARPSPEAQAMLDPCEQALRCGDTTLMLGLARRFVATHPETAAAHRMLAIAAHKHGDATTRDSTLDLLAERSAAGDMSSAEERMIALLAVGDVVTAAAIAKSRLCTNPRELVSAIVLQDALFGLGERDAFIEIAPKSLRLCNRLLPDLSATVARHLAESLGASDTSYSARLLVAAGLIDGNIGLARAKARSCKADVPWIAIERAVAEAALRAPVAAAAWLHLHRKFYDDDELDVPWASTLEEHIVMLGEHCNRLGVRLVVVGYPFRHEGLEAVQRRAAQRLGAPFVDVDDEFAKALAGGERSALFVANGHCNDDGYELLAKLVAETVSGLLN